MSVCWRLTCLLIHRRKRSLRSAVVAAQGLGLIQFIFTLAQARGFVRCVTAQQLNELK